MSPSRYNVFSSDIDIELFFIIIYAIITNFRKINKVTYTSYFRKILNYN